MSIIENYTIPHILDRSNCHIPNNPQTMSKFLESSLMCPTIQMNKQIVWNKKINLNPLHHKLPNLCYSFTMQEEMYHRFSPLSQNTRFLELSTSKTPFNARFTLVGNLSKSIYHEKVNTLEGARPFQRYQKTSLSTIVTSSSSKYILSSKL